MKYRQWIALIFLLAGVQARSASFDCDLSRTSVEKMICADNELSVLDYELGAQFDSLKGSVRETQAAARLTSEQRQWLRDVRNRCQTKDCLVTAYKNRKDQLNPIADKSITCEEMRQFPELIFSQDVDLGSGYGSPIDFDGECPESLGKLYLGALMQLAERIRGSNGPQFCSGSIIHAQWRYYHFDLSRAGFAPSTLRRTRYYLVEDNDEQVVRYFKQWAERSQFNFDQYSSFMAEHDRVLPMLIQHYEKQLSLSRADAQVAARDALRIVTYRAAGSFPRDTLRSESPLELLARDDRATLSDYDRNLRTNSDQIDAYWALRIALIRNRSLQIIALLTESVSPDLFESFRQGSDPILSLAFGNQQNLEYLIRRGAPLDEANDFGKTSLFYAIGANNHMAVEALLKAGASANLTYKSASELRPEGDTCTYYALTHTKRTPLMHAAQNSDVAMIELLIQAGATTDSVDDLNYSALDYSVKEGKSANAAYLKSLGVEIEAPRYSSLPDPAVREHELKTILPIDGFVHKLLIAPGRPDLLVASVGPGISRQSNSPHALYIFSTADPLNPKLLSIFPAIQVNDFALSPDGRRIYLLEVRNQQSPTDKNFGLSIIDLTNSENPVRVDRVVGDFMTMHLSPDGAQMFLQERKLLPEYSRGLLVYDVGPSAPRLSCSNPFGDMRYEGQIFAYGFGSFPDEPLLAIHTQSSELLLFDVKNPCAPSRILAVDSGEMSPQFVALPGKTIIVNKQTQLERIRVGASAERLATYTARIGVFSANAKADAVTVVIESDVAILQTDAKGRFVLTDRFRLKPSLFGGVLRTDSGHIYVGWNGALGVGVVPRE